jgi:polar amino acid transport system substrate-binding protein
MAGRKGRRAAISALVISAITLAASVAGSGLAAAQEEEVSPDVQRVRDNGLYVAFVGENPWSFLDPSGVWTGAEAEMVKECAETLGITEIYPVNVQFDGLLPGLQARRYDMIAAGMSLREARLEVAIGSQLLYRYGTRIVGRQGDPVLQELTSWTKVGESGIPVAGIRGSTEITDTEPFGVEWVEYPDNPTELADLLAGRIQLMAWNDNYYGSFIRENPDVPIEAVSE